MQIGIRRVSIVSHVVSDSMPLSEMLLNHIAWPFFEFAFLKNDHADT